MSRPKRGEPTQIQEALRRISVADGDGCVEWIGTYSSTGYGQAWYEGRKYKAHRLTYELLVGPIPDGLVMDHLCRNIKCVLPSHLEPVTPRENALRSVGGAGDKARQTHCKRGHEFTPENTMLKGAGRTRRNCRKCNALRSASEMYRAKKNAARRRRYREAA